MKTETTLSRPVRIVVIGAGNRAHKYLEYARRNPEQLRLAAIVEVNDLRRRAMADAFGLPDKYCYAHYDDFFAEGLDADMVLISTPENAHFDPAVKAIDAGYHVLLEKPIAQRLDECREIARRARRRVLVGVCHVLRYHPYFAKIRELVASGRLGHVVSVNHTASVGLDRATHSYVRGIFRRESEANPILLAKCCHDIDFLLWLTGSHCRRLSSFGSLRWFRAENAPEGSAAPVSRLPDGIRMPLLGARPLLRPPRLGLELRRAARSDARCDDSGGTAHGNAGPLRLSLRQRRGRSPAAFDGDGRRGDDEPFDGDVYQRRLSARPTSG